MLLLITLGQGDCIYMTMKMFDKEKLLKAIDDNLVIFDPDKIDAGEFTLGLAFNMREFGWKHGYGNMVKLHLPKWWHDVVMSRIKMGYNDYVSTYNYEVLDGEEASRFWVENGASFYRNHRYLAIAEFESGRYLPGSF